jgi:hypothetical protein
VSMHSRLVGNTGKRPDIQEQRAFNKLRLPICLVCEIARGQKHSSSWVEAKGATPGFVQNTVATMSLRIALNGVKHHEPCIEKPSSNHSGGVKCQ